MATLRDSALAAYNASQADRVDEARTFLGLVLTPFDVSTLEVAEIDVSDRYTLVVFTDGDVHMGVELRDSEKRVHLVRDDAGWTRLAQVGSLAELGKVVDDLSPADVVPDPSYTEWVQPTGAHDAYALGARVTWNGKTWESTVGANVWEPGVSGWREVAA